MAQKNNCGREMRLGSSERSLLYMLRRYDPSKPVNMTARERGNEIAAILSRGLRRLGPARQKKVQKAQEKPLSCRPENRSL